MGLDGVELVMEVEEHFGITIQETTAERIRTVGDLIALIHNRLTRSRESHCANLAAFLTLRSVVRQVTGNDALRFRPSYRIENTLTPRQRRVLWKRLAEILGAVPRRLRRPPLDCTQCRHYGVGYK